MDITSGTPYHYSLGTDDQSIREVPYKPKSISQHTPIFYLITEKGDYEEREVNGLELEAFFGSNTLNPLSKFSNHASMYAKQVINNGGTAIIKRTPYFKERDDAEYETGKANVTIYATINKTPFTVVKLLRDELTGEVERVDGELLENNNKIANIFDSKSNTLFIKRKNTRYSVSGDNSLYQYGNGTNISEVSFIDVPLKKTLDIIVGKGYTVAKDSNNVYVTGINTNGAMGEPRTVVERKTFTKTDLRFTKQIAVGEYNIYAVDKYGYLWFTGLNDKGQGGIGITDNVYGFIKTGLKDVYKIASAKATLFVIKNNKELLSVGSNEDGLLAIGEDITHSANYVACKDSNGEPILDAVDVIAGENFVYIKREDGTWWSAGNGSHGQLGLGNTDNKNLFTKVELEIDPVYIKAGNEHIIYQGINGKIYSTGRNDYGQCLNGGTDDILEFTDTELKYIENFYTWNNGGGYTDNEGDTYVTGENGNGQLGLGHTDDVTKPTLLEIENETSDGYYVYLSARYHDDRELADGLPTITTPSGMVYGNQVAETISYPLYTFRAEGHGEYYNNIGIAIEPLVGEDSDKYMVADGQFPFAILKYDKTSGRAIRVKNIYGGMFSKFTTKPLSIHPLYRTGNSIEDIFPKYYTNIENDVGLIKTKDFEDIIVYQNNIEELSKFIMEKEILVNNNEIISWADYDNPDIEEAAKTADRFKYLTNIFNLKTTSGVPYEAVRPTSSLVLIPDLLKLNTGEKVIASMETPIYLRGGKDGRVDNLSLYEDNIIAEIDRYGDIDDPIVDTANSNVSFLYDVGFELETKLKIGKFISVRRDTMIAGSTYIFNEENKKQNIEEALAIASLIKKSYQMYPESVVFGTSTARATITMGSGIVKDGSYRYRLPMTYDRIKKLTMFYKPDGSVDTNRSYDRQDGNIVTELVDLDITEIPNSIKRKLWDAGLIWVQKDGKNRWFYTSKQTIYDNDTSVLNSELVIIGIMYIAKINDAAWRRFTGTDSLTNQELKMLVEDYINARLESKFANLIKYRVNVFFTPEDLLRGYSWHLEVKVYANNMKTVQESYIIALRMTDYDGN